MTEPKRVGRVHLSVLFLAAAILLPAVAVSRESRAEAPKPAGNPRLLWTYDAGG